MGYITWVNIAIISRDAKSKKKVEAFKEIAKEAEVLKNNINGPEAEFEDNNGNMLQKIVTLSKANPDLTMEGEIDGTTEDKTDRRRFRIRAGEYEEVMAKVTFPPFRKITCKR